MAETETVEKHYYSPCDNNSALWGALMSQKDNSPLETMALMNNNGMGNWGNNPFFYLIWMWMMRWMNNGEGFNGAENFNSRQIAALQETVNTNHNNDLVMSAIQGNGGAIHELATNLNVDFNTMSQAVCGVKSAIESVGANVGFSAERIINAISQGDSNIISSINTTACATQKAILEQGYQNQLANERQTGILASKIDDFRAADQLQTCQQTNALQNSIYTSTNTLVSNLSDVRQAMVNGFSNIGYTMAQDTCQILQGQKDQTRAILDTLNNHWQTETALALQDAKNEISNMNQTQKILSAINGCGCCNS